MRTAGIDGCRAGWLAVFADGDHYAWGVFASMESLLAEHPGLDRILLDMPMGLSSPGFPRTVDQGLRRSLPGRGSTVFSVPCRRAVYAETYDEARALNREETGKSLSVQSWNICGKIREMDELLASPGRDSGKPQFIESHPELCFKILNGGRVLPSRKAEAKGADERLDLLEKADPDLKTLFQEMKTLKRKNAKIDDMLDALCLGYASRGDLGFLEDENRADERGIPLRVAYPAKSYQLV